MDIYWDNRAASKTVKVCNIGTLDCNTSKCEVRGGSTGSKVYTIYNECDGSTVHQGNDSGEQGKREGKNKAE